VLYPALTPAEAAEVVVPHPGEPARTDAPSPPGEDR
jgi:hypothetical protein